VVRLIAAGAMEVLVTRTLLKGCIEREAKVSEWLQQADQGIRIHPDMGLRDQAGA
jgi:hypothetical protein